MKYNEAIDMILDGGKATVKGAHKNFWIFFGTDSYLKSSGGLDYLVCKQDFKREDWIVEKDGVVYEEYHPFVGKKDWFKTFSEDVSCPHCHSKDLMKVMIKDIESALYTCAKCQWQGMFVEPHQIIADEVNEDWLEKKILCFMKRHNVATIIKRDYEDDDIDDLEGHTIINSNYTCHNTDCPFCFPETVKSPWQENAKFFTEINNIRKSEPCTCTQVGSERILCTHCVKRYIEEPREKVTVDSLEELINICVRGVTYWEDVNNPVEERRRSLSMAREAREEIMKKLEYLVSLQEKE